MPRSTRGRSVGPAAVILAMVAMMAAAPIAGANAQETLELRNAELRSVDAGSDFGATLAGLVVSPSAGMPGPSWIAWEVDAVPARGMSCCGGANSDGVCRLEEGGGWHGRHEDEPAVAASRLRVLLRVSGGRVQRLRTFTSGCVLDAGGLPVVWIRGMDAVAGLRALRELVEGTGALGPLAADEDVGEAAVGAVAQHGGTEAVSLLAGWARRGSDGMDGVQSAAIFWLGAARGRDGLPVLSELLREHSEAAVRERAVFGLHVSGVPEAVDLLVQAARADADGGVRGQALFWLAQRAGERAAAAIEGAVAQDEDLQVRKRAVFALSQLPPDRGVPVLIRIASTHPQPEMRKQALFWLGQSGDARALEFIETLLRR